MERTIQVMGDLKDLGELLDGAGIDQARLAPSDGRLRLDMELTRACPELQAAARPGFGGRRKVPWVKSRLVLERITDAAVQRVTDGGAAQPPLLACEAIAGGYTVAVTSHDGLRLVLTMDQLSGAFQDIGQPVANP
jgi:hypothetical protein